MASLEQNLSVTCSPDFSRWLSSTGGSIAFTTYEAGKLFLLGVDLDGNLSVFERTFPRSMGLAVSVDGRRLALATKYHVQSFDNVLPAGTVSTEGFDALYGPHAAWVTGSVDAHDVAFGPDGRPIFVNTLFACIASVSDDHSFRPIWKPPFISRLAPEDRCHLNGMATANGTPCFATAVALSDTAEGWRDRRVAGGLVLDIAQGEIVVRDLSMPHSPRIHEDRLWLLNSGTGELGCVDLDAGRFEPIAFCPGYARGLTFIEGHAVVGLSVARQNRTFADLPLDANLRARGTDARCGLAVFNLGTGDMVHWVRLEGPVRELYDVATLPRVRRPSLVGFKGDEVKHLISIED
jgi:uncharacterized protein (TIGR03032 family)